MNIDNILAIFTVLVAVAALLTAHAQYRSWRNQPRTLGRCLTVGGWLVVAVAAAATLQAGWGQDDAALLLLGVLVRLCADLANAGRRRAKRRERLAVTSRSH